MREYNSMETEALSILPYRLASNAQKCAAANKVIINELRLRVGQPLCITAKGENYPCGIVCTKEDVDFVIRNLSGNSLYSHADTIRQGYITSKSGLRAGVCGRAVTDGNQISVITDITSISIRIPRRVCGAGDYAFELLKQRDFSCGLLVYSRPGVGKTTLLRELIVKLSGGEMGKRVAVVDTRCELDTGIKEAVMADVLSSYPRSVGIEIALRTLSPEYIICDEITSPEEAEALLTAVGSGVSVVASVHADSFENLMKNDNIRRLAEKKAFGVYLGLLDIDAESGGYVTEVSFFSEAGEEETLTENKVCEC